MKSAIEVIANVQMPLVKWNTEAAVPTRKMAKLTGLPMIPLIIA